MSKTQSGSIILLHNGTKHTAEALGIFLPILKEKGFRFVKASEIIYREGFSIDHTGRQMLIQR